MEDSHSGELACRINHQLIITMLLVPTKRQKLPPRTAERYATNLHQRVAELNSQFDDISRGNFGNKSYRHFTLIEVNSWPETNPNGGRQAAGECKAAKLTVQLTSPSEEHLARDLKNVILKLTGRPESGDMDMVVYNTQHEVLGAAFDRQASRAKPAATIETIEDLGIAIDAGHRPDPEMQAASLPVAVEVDEEVP